MGVMTELPQLPKSLIIKSVEWYDSEAAGQENRAANQSKLGRS